MLISTNYFSCIDLEKAYDRVSWEFLDGILTELRIPPNFKRIIMNCVTSTSINILWNGEKTDTFKPSRGLRQGDPLSPYLFVLCMEKLSQVIEDCLDEGEWRALRAGMSGPCISHLFFADDIILFGEASLRQADCMMRCLNLFCNASGQRVSSIF